MVLFSEITRLITIYCWQTNNASLNTQWFVIIQTLCCTMTGLALFTFFVRLKGIYCVREIEDIIILDKS